MLKFEIKKFYYSKKNFTILILLALLLIISHLYSLNVITNESHKKEIISNITYGISKAQEKLQDPSYPTELIFGTKNRIKVYHQKIEALETNHFNKYFEMNNKQNLEILEQTKDDKQLKKQSEIIQQEVDYYNLVKSRNLDFELMPGGQEHAFGAFINTPLSSMFTSMYLLIFSVLISVQISSHFESKEFRFNDFAKLSRSRTLFSKVMAALLVTFGWLLTISVVDVLVVGVMNGFGSLNYPAYLENFTKAAQEANHWKIDNMAIPNGEVIGISLLYLLLVLIFLAAAGAFLSVLVKRSLVVIGILAVLIVGWSLVIEEPFLQPIRPFVPMSYFNPMELLCHPFYLFGKNSLIVGVVYLLVLSIVCLFVANLLFKNYKIRRV